MYLPDELERLRVEQNLSIRELSRRAGVSPPTTTAVLVGRGNVRSVVRVANALKHSIRWTFEDAETRQRRVLFLAGNLQTQVGAWRKKYTKATAQSLIAPGLSATTILHIERGLPCHFATLERLARLLGLEPVLVRGANDNVMDVIDEGNRDEQSRQHC